MDLRELEGSFYRVGKEDPDNLLKYWENLLTSYDAKAQGPSYPQWSSIKKGAVRSVPPFRQHSRSAHHLTPTDLHSPAPPNIHNLLIISDTISPKM